MTQRDEYVAKLKAQLDRWNADMAKWEAKAREAQAGAQAQYAQQLASVRQRRDQVFYQLALLQSATADAWTDLMQGTDEAWARMRKAFDEAAGHFEKK